LKVIKILTASADDANLIQVSLDDEVKVLSAKTWHGRWNGEGVSYAASSGAWYLQLVIEYPVHEIEWPGDERGYGS
jgi:hypothetical protein